MKEQSHFERNGFGACERLCQHEFQPAAQSDTNQ